MNVSSLTEEEPPVTQDSPVTKAPETGDHLMSMLLVLGAFGLICGTIRKRRNLG